MKLYELSTSILQLETVLEEQLDAPEELRGEALKFLDELKLSKTEKVENCVSLLKNWEALEVAIKAEETALKARRESLERRAEWLKNYLSFCLQPGEKFETARCKVSWRKSESVQILDESKVPLEYTEEVVTRKVNKALIKDAIKNGADIPGAELIKKNNLVIK